MNEARRPKIYEWVEEEERLPTPKVVKREKTYDERLVAFIDVLGMAERSLNASAEQVLTLMGNLRLRVRTECESLNKTDKVQFLQLGDGFTIIADLKSIDRLCGALSRIQLEMLVAHQMMVRGALTAGPIGLDQDVKYIVGPAFIDAFRLESRNAIYPRIILARKIEQYMTDRSIRISFEHIIEDNDKFKYLDFIGHNIAAKGNSSETLDNLLVTQGTKAVLKSEYETFLTDNEVVAQKYGWLISKLAEHSIKVL